MNDGTLFREGFEELFQHSAGIVQIHKNWGTPDQQITELRGMKNNEKGRRDKVMFQFLESVDVQIGDLIQQKGARDLWRVYDVEDDVIGDTFVLFEAKVEKFTGGKPTTQSPGVVIHGSVLGGVQVGTQHSSQSVNISISSTEASLQKLREILNASAIPDLEKEEAAHALNRILELTHKPKNADVIARIKDKLAVVTSIFSISKSTADLARPYIDQLSNSILA